MSSVYVCVSSPIPVDVGTGSGIIIVAPKFAGAIKGTVYYSVYSVSDAVRTK